MHILLMWTFEQSLHLSHGVCLEIKVWLVCGVMKMIISWWIHGKGFFLKSTWIQYYSHLTTLVLLHTITFLSFCSTLAWVKLQRILQTAWLLNFGSQEVIKEWLAYRTSEQTIHTTTSTENHWYNFDSRQQYRLSYLT